MTIFGWDASHYDWDRGTVDVAAAKRDSIVFATHKVSESTGYADPRFSEFANRARTAGMPLIGGYCVNRRGDQKPQVDWFIRQLDSKAPWWRDGDFLIQLDCERWSYAPEPLLADIRAWCGYFTARTGGRHRPIVYAPKWVYGDSLRGLEYPLWASSYGDNPPVAYRTAYPGDGSTRWAAYSGQTPAILQYGSKTIIGAQRTCDANAFRGSLEQLRTLTRGDDVITSDDLEKIRRAVWHRDIDTDPEVDLSAGSAVLRTNTTVNTIAAKVAELGDGGIDLPLLAQTIAAALDPTLRAIVREEINNTRLGPAQ